MSSRYYNTTNSRWHLGKVWAYNTGRTQWESDYREFIPRSIHTPYIGEGTVWTRDVTNMPLDPNSAQYAAWMWAHSPTEYNSVTGGASGAWGAKTALNTSQQNTHPIATCVVDSTDPYCRYQTIDTTVGVPGAIGGTNETAIVNGSIPWPDGFTPALNGDRGMAIYDAGKGIIREYFNVQAVANKPGHWTTTIGGYSIARPHFENLAQTNYSTQFVGSSAVVKMHNSLGFIGIDEVRAKEIPHALAFTAANLDGTGFPNVVPSWPALASDGKYPPSTWSGWQENGGAAGPWPGPTPKHGQWGRLPLTVNPQYNPRTSQPYSPLTQLIIVAAQKYGLVATDTNAWAHAFNAESGNREKALTGVDPWTGTTGEMAKLLSEYSGYNVSAASALDVSDFPWDLTQWAPADWGRPNPDWRLHTGEYLNFYPYHY